MLTDKRPIENNILKPIISFNSFGIGLYLNIDGSVRLEDGSAAAGGIVRNRNGEWVTDFNRLLGSCSVFEAELWGILDGLNILIDQGLDNVLIETDNLEAVTTIKESLTGRSNSTLIGRILKLLYQLHHWNICHIPKEDN
ncbi:hypothetical protein Goari_018091 [Gossypium aridum]|uniref:RNase H type-1 domain-containing protein n=1 Tax=Gossypium aridum TaxID=34290 RepID=A0A7J8WNU3_GOSAI|nr:hypothetical protein [Gossypium aridum]